MSMRTVESKTVGGRLWLMVDYGTHWAIIGANTQPDGTRPVYSVGERAYIARRWRAM